MNNIGKTLLCGTCGITFVGSHWNSKFCSPRCAIVNMKIKGCNKGKKKIVYPLGVLCGMEVYTKKPIDIRALVNIKILVNAEVELFTFKGE